MSLDRPDLSTAFLNKKTPVDRAAGLTGLLPAPRTRPSTSPSTTTPSTRPTPVSPPIEAAPTDDTAPVAEATTPKTVVKPIRATKNPPVSDSADITVNVAIYLEPDLLELVKARRRASELTYDELVQNAFATVAEDQIRATFDQTAATPQTSGMPVRKRRLRGTAGIQLQLRLDTAQRTWLEDTRQRVGAPSRSALVATVLRLHLAN